MIGADRKIQQEKATVAAMLACGIACVVFGLFTVLSESSPGAKDWLRWSAAAGPLSGKAGMAVIVWIFTWIVLHRFLPAREGLGRTWYAFSLVLIALALLLTFPPFFMLFA